MIWFLWTAYFVSSVIGYVGMKWAADSTVATSKLSLAPFFTLWGALSLGAWAVSAIVWPWLLARTSLHWANSFSSLRIVFVSVAAVILFGEAITPGRVAGILLITGGVVLCR